MGYGVKHMTRTTASTTDTMMRSSKAHD